MSYYTAAGAEVVEVSVPMHTEGPIIWNAATRISMSEWSCQGRPSGHLSYLAPHIRSRWPPDQGMYDQLTATNPAVMNIIFTGKLLGETLGPSVEAKAHRKVFELRAAYDRALEDVDVLVTPCAPTVAMPHPVLMTEDGSNSTVMEKLNVTIGIVSNTCPFNVTGHPALSVPCGFGSVRDQPEVRLPIGMQIVGKRWDEEAVLKAAAIFEEGRKNREKSDL